MAGFVHLNVHTGYSITDGLGKPADIIDLAVANGMDAVAITDIGNMFTTIGFYEKARKAGITPVIGAEVSVLPEAVSDDQGGLITDDGYIMTLIAQTEEGYRNLMTIVSHAQNKGLVDEDFSRPAPGPFTTERFIADNSAGIVALSGGVDGRAGHLIGAGRFDEARRHMAHWQSIFGDRYLTEVTRTGRKREENYLATAVEMSIDLDIPIVATNSVRFPHREDFEVHEARVAIQQGQTLESRGYATAYSPHQYFKSEDEMRAIFPDLPEAIDNAATIAAGCHFDIELNTPRLPHYSLPEGESESDHLAQIAMEGLERRLNEAGYQDSDVRLKYAERLENELGIINSMGFPGYFLVVADFIRWSREQGIPVGPGRGSGAGSLVAYSCGITNIDPVQHGLIFERFLNPERVSMPDIDIDFCEQRRDDVINYVSERYGRDAVSMISTFTLTAAKASIKDAARVMGYNYSMGEKVSAMVSKKPGIKLQGAMDESQPMRDMYDSSRDARTIIDMAMRLEGTPRSVGRHASGVVISPTRLSDFTPVHNSGRDVGSQYDGGDVEKAGLIKFDFLGLNNLTIIDNAMKMINKRREAEGLEPLDVNRLPMEDEKSYNLLRRGDTTAVFQLESGGIKGLIKRLSPDSFEELTAVLALYRPGPLMSGMVDSFVKRKHGEQKIEYYHPSLEEILKPTYGVIVYQEQVMQIGRELAGYSMGQADMLRRAMGKKKPEEMAAQRKFFVEGAVANNVGEQQAGELFDIIDKFAGYGFNKSHSAAYAMISWQTAYLKAHYPVEFMSSVLTAHRKKPERNVNFVADVLAGGHRILNPDINKSREDFRPTNKGNILFGLSAIRGVGDRACENIILERERNGPYRDIFDLVRRTESAVTKTTIRALVDSGAMDSFRIDRSVLRASVEIAMDYRKACRNAAKKGDDPDGIAHPEVMVGEGSSPGEKLALEATALGIYISGHPMDEYRDEVAPIVTASNSDISLDEHGFTEDNRRFVFQVGAINNVVRKKKITSMMLDDGTGAIPCIMFGDTAKKYRDRIESGEVIGVKGRLKYDDYRDDVALFVTEITSLREIREQNAAQLVIKAENSLLSDDETMREIAGVIGVKSPGYCRVIPLESDSSCPVATPLPGSVVPDDEMLRYLRKNGLHAEIRYHGNTVDVRVPEMKRGREKSLEPENIDRRVKQSLLRVKGLLDETSSERGDNARPNTISRAKRSEAPTP